MKYGVVTSCSAAGWKEYGARFVKTFLKFWPASVELVLCSEDDLSKAAAKFVDYENFTILDLRAAAGVFIDRHSNNALTHGKRQAPGQRGWSGSKIARGYNFRYDAARFGLKAFAIDMAAQRRSAGKLFWVDADVVTFESMPVSLLDQTLPADFALSCLDRGSEYHSDCSWVGYNLDHPQTRPFIAAFKAIYDNDSVLKLAEWHDSWVFDWLRREHRVPTHCIPHTSRGHPVPNSAIGAFCDHLKGDRKKVGRTAPSELTQPHDHKYWNAA